MHEHQNRDPLEPVLQQAANAYHQPPTTPRRELWLQLQHARALRRPRPFRSWQSHPLTWATGIAATLAFGVGLGRLSVRQPEQPLAPVAAAVVASPPTNTAAYRVTAAEYLGQAEVFLTLFRMSVRHGVIDSLAPATARPLLATNRILLDSPASTDPKIRGLLEDLEVVLAQIVQLSPRPMKGDLQSITTGIEQTNIMTRLWSKAAARPIGT